MITLDEQIAEAQRELALRRKCYPAWVKSGEKLVAARPMTDDGCHCEEEDERAEAQQAAASSLSTHSRFS